MRIVAGSRGGQKLRRPTGLSIRPTPDRVREALFSILADRAFGSHFADLYAGTGAVGLEALSRGAASAVFVEWAQPAIAIIKKNITALKFEDRTTVVRGRLPGVLRKLAATHVTYDVVFADPPYRGVEPDRLLGSKHWDQITTARTLFVVESQRGLDLTSPGWHIDDVRDYGDTRLTFLHREDPT